MTSQQTDRTAIVTGGGAGIGLATVEILLRDGWRVAVLDRDAAALEAARDELAAHHARLRFERADVTDTSACAALVARIAAEFGPLKGLATVAGIGANVSFFDTEPELLRRVMEVNVLGTLAISQAAAAVMKGTGGGAIVTVSSVSGLVGNAGRTAYGASKGAVVNMTRVMAVELARHGIRVNSIAPGPIETAMARAAHSEAVRRQWCDDVPLARYGTTHEVAEAIAFLLDGRRASYITGQILAVDGGFVAAGLTDRS